MPTVSMAKNIMRRAIREIVDPELTRLEKDALWAHFESCCAFCGKPIERSSRTGHVDHLEGGDGNGPRNRVLACARCNGDEKRERPWRDFLAEKSIGEAVAAERHARIEAWVEMHERRAPEVPAVAKACHEAERIVDEFHAACTKIRKALKQG